MVIKDDELINESYRKRPGDFWKWSAFVILFVLVLMGIQWGLKESLEEKICESPFQRVTNREMSTFVWQNPSFMRANQKRKQGYLPAFQYLDKVNVEPELADSWAVAPPEVLFTYHTWNRILGDLWIPTVIEPKEFQKFLEYADEWQPEYWEDAPESYVALVGNLDNEKGDLAPKLPQSVRLAFQGWHEYFLSGDEINSMSPTFAEVEAFLQKYPQYSRSLWKNIVGDNYLKSSGEGYIPQDELTAFLKAALFRTSQKNDR